MRGVGEDVQAIKASNPRENSFNSLKKRGFSIGK